MAGDWARDFRRTFRLERHQPLHADDDDGRLRGQQRHAVDSVARANDFGNFLKNIGLMGGACFAVALPEPWPGSLRPAPVRARQRDGASGRSRYGGSRAYTVARAG